MEGVMALQIYESAEDYLEAVLIIRERKGVVHSIDIAEELHFSKASVSVAMKKLRENGYIIMEKDGSIKLCPPGEEIAQRMYERHRLFTDYFISLGVDPKTAQEDACRIEHDLSDETFEKLKEVLLRKENSGS